MAQLSTTSSQRIVKDSGHEIHLYEPSAVVRGIQDVVDAVRHRSKVPER
ncbi:MAG: hypothetical protein HY047_00375 [Acidobacteria bacterium]|nr:hypothetical protein [Acidobacteriota bacterium]